MREIGHVQTAKIPKNKGPGSLRRANTRAQGIAKNVDVLVLADRNLWGEAMRHFEQTEHSGDKQEGKKNEPPCSLKGNDEWSNPENEPDGVGPKREGCGRREDEAYTNHPNDADCRESGEML